MIKNHQHFKNAMKIAPATYRCSGINIYVENPISMALFLKKIFGINILAIEGNRKSGITATMSILNSFGLLQSSHRDFQIRLFQRGLFSKPPFELCMRTIGSFEEALRQLYYRGIIQNEFISQRRAYKFDQYTSLDKEKLILLESPRYFDLTQQRKNLLLKEYGVNPDLTDFFFTSEKYPLLKTSILEIQLKVYDFEAYIDLFTYYLKFRVIDKIFQCGKLRRVKFSLNEKANLKLNIELGNDGRAFQDSVRFVLDAEIDSRALADLLRQSGREFEIPEEHIKDFEALDSIDYYKFNFDGVRWLLLAGDKSINNKLPSPNTKDIDF